MTRNWKEQHTKGYLVILVLVFGAAFFMSIAALGSFLVLQKRAQTVKTDKERALQIAEAGLDYYKWFLAHNPNNTTDGTGQAGPYVHEYSDPEGGEIGEFSLQVSGNSVCGETTAIDITSTGYTYANPGVKRTIYARYAKPSITEFAYILNSNVWAGADRTIVGPYHSNGGIRMDGTNNSTVSSGLSTWSCTSSFGCSPTQTKNGVFGAGTGYLLWDFPTAPIDFAGITVNLVQMKAKAQASGRYIAPSGNRGYHIIFRNNNTFDLYRVTGTTQVWGYDTEEEWQQENNIISNETFIANYPVPSSCSVIFVEDKLWLEGTLSSKVTIAAANVTTPNVDPSMILPDNILYTASDGSVGLTAIAEDSILIALDSPNNMTLNGVFIAQNGHFGRNHYETDSLSTAWDPYVTRNVLNMIGTVVSNGRVGTQWTCGGDFCSGYAQRNDSYDRNLSTAPPPLTPYVSNTYRFIEWREVN